MSSPKDLATAATGDTGSEPNGETKVATMSLRALARAIGVDDKAIRNGIRSGRLTRSIGRGPTGKPTVIDADLARLEWAENAGKLNPVRSAESAVIVGVNTLNEAQRGAALERGRKLRIENDLREGRVLDVAAVSREAFESARIIREAILNIPARLSAELAAETDPGRLYVKLDAALREALTSTADRLLAVGE